MWLLLAVLAYILFAAATVTDKYLLQRPIPDARVYAFYTGIFGLFAFVLAPFGFEVPNSIFIFLGIFAGMLFISSLFLFFVALRIGEVSRVGISLGGLVPFFTLLFVYIGTGEFPEFSQAMAFALLAGGSFIIIFERLKKFLHNIKIFSLVLTSSFLFGLYFTLAKFLFQAQPFVSAFIWIKVGGALFAISFLFFPEVRKILFEHKKSPPKKAGGIFVAKNITGGLGAILLHLAISIARFGEVALVNALQGVQFALIFFIALFLTKKFPKIIKEEIHTKALVVKILGTTLIIAGVILLVI